MNNQLLEEERGRELEQILEEEQTQSDADHKYLAFYVDSQLYGICIAVVTEILQAQEATPMPELPPYVKGILNLRGTVLPIIDLGLRFGKEEKAYTDRTCIVIVSVGDNEAGMVVDRVAEVVTLEDGDICPPPIFGGEERGRYVTGICKMNEGMLLVLDHLQIFSDSELGSPHRPQ